MNVIDIIRQEIMCNPVLIFMKGSPKQPKCPYSRKAVNALVSTNLPFSHVDVSQSLEIQQALPKVADWPTFPLVFIDGELIGGGDTVVELNEAGSLKLMMKVAINKAAG
ncbi:MAG: glutaredoxin domain-containing protein [Sedimenticola sp.]